MNILARRPRPEERAHQGRLELDESRRTLARAWSRLPQALRLPTQFLGRHYAGCGATIGAMPRCDFQCQGCYLTRDANGARPLPMADIEAQLDSIRAWLGPGGNVQLTDGELTLRAESELISMIAYARRIGLVPMLMTHGETFRRDPDMLARLVRAGLSEVCFHIDTTMQGRRDAYATADSEVELNGLRDEFADLIRTTRRRTGRRIAAASTVTVSRSNVSEVPAIVRWFLAHADAFKMVSFQPVAAVGRTTATLRGVTAEELWARIAEGSGVPDIARGFGYFGHPDCSRFVQGLAGRGKRKFVPLYDNQSRDDMRLLEQLLTRLGGTRLRHASRRRVLQLGMQAMTSSGLFLLRHVPAALLRRAWVLRSLRPRYFCIVSHHFMSATELDTERGRERLANCAFRVPVDGKLESMCAVNALGLREQLYARNGRAAVTPRASFAAPAAAGRTRATTAHAEAPSKARVG